MEQYCPDMAEWVAKQLAQVPDKTLVQLRAYYEQRVGPGLALVQAEQAARMNQPLQLSQPDEHVILS
jgi:hypothetical protein